MEAETAVAVACRWCGQPGAEICPRCDRVALAIVRRWGQVIVDHLDSLMYCYLTSLWASQVNGHWVCNNCMVESLVEGPRCPACGYPGDA